MSVPLADLGLALCGLTAFVVLAVATDLLVDDVMDWLSRRYRDQEDRG